MRHVPFDRATVSGSLVDRRIVHKTAFYADVLEPQGIADMLCASHLAMAHDGGVGGFGFALSMGATEQADVAARKFQRVLPHLSRALDSAMKFGGLADGTRQLTRVMALMPNPALLLDSSGRIITANPAAELLLRNGDGLTSDAVGVPQLSAALPSEKRALSRALAQALAIASGTDDKLAEPLRLTRPSGAPPLLVLIIPLPPPAFSLWEMLGAARVMVLAVDPAAQAIASTATVCSAFGLTNAEARVALLIAGGFSGPQTAAALGISPQTVKTHLRRCFEKTGVHSQVGLARLFAGLPATD
jgi:DNA-binding CsgD family transcriptional regulator